MEYQYRIFFLNKEFKESGTATIAEMPKEINEHIKTLIRSLEAKNYNKHISIGVDTAEYHVSITSIQKL